MSRHSRNKKMLMTRRQAIAACGVGAAAFHPGLTLLNGLVDGIIGKAMAAESDVTPRALVNYHLGGAPARWHWDLPLSPYANKTPLASPLMNTKIVSNKLGYGTTPITSSFGDLYLPSLWASQIPLSNGGTVAMTELAKNMLIMRGIAGVSVSHPDGAVEMTRPNASAPSILGTVADASKNPVQSALFGGDSYGLPFTAFRAKHSAQTVARNINSALNDLLLPFNRSSENYGATYMNRRAAMDALISRGLASLGKFASSNHPGSDSLFSMRNSAELVMKNGVKSALDSYAVTLNKYKTLISRCGDWSKLGLAGVTESAINLPAVNRFNMINETVSSSDFCVQNPDLRTIIQARTTPSSMAESFAVAEILVSQGLSSSVMMGSSSIRNMNFIQPKSLVNGEEITSNNIWTYDQHDSGSLTSLVANSFLFQCLAACIYEFQTALAAKGLWKETVFMVTSDFGRNIRTDDGSTAAWSGADHDPSACNYSVFSGAISAPSVIGNVGPTKNQGAKYVGDWGQNRPVANLFGANRSLTAADAVSTIAALTRVDSPLDNNPSLVSANGSPLIEKAREAA